MFQQKSTKPDSLHSRGDFIMSSRKTDKSSSYWSHDKDWFGWLKSIPLTSFSLDDGFHLWYDLSKGLASGIHKLDFIRVHNNIIREVL